MAKPTLTPVDSANIAAIGHDGETNTLFVQFKRAGQPHSTYSYAGVTPEAFEEFRNADSLGSHFHDKIRPNYSYERLDDVPAATGANTAEA